jgi:hypothetical protein
LPAELRKLIRLNNDILVLGILIARHNFIIIDFAVDGTDFLVMDSTVTLIVKPDEVNLAPAFHLRWVKFDRDRYQTEAQQSTPDGYP